MKPSEILNYEELVEILCGIDSDIDSLLYDKFEVDFEQFCRIAEALISYTIKAQIVTLGGREECAQGFVHDGAFIVKRVVDCTT